VTFTTGYRTGDGQVVITYNVNGRDNNQVPGNGDNCTGDLNNNSTNWGPNGQYSNACEANRGSPRQTPTGPSSTGSASRPDPTGG
jgi:hypothetical protein